MSAKDGGAAFPRVGEIGAEVYINYPGMTLRDYFAAKAMQGILAAGDYHSPFMGAAVGVSMLERVSTAAHDYADAMLAALEQQP